LLINHSLDSPFFIVNFGCENLIPLSIEMNKVKSKDFFPVIINLVLCLTSGGDDSKTSSSFLKYSIIRIKMIGTSLFISDLEKQNLNYNLIESFN